MCWRAYRCLLACPVTDWQRSLVSQDRFLVTPSDVRATACRKAGVDVLCTVLSWKNQYVCLCDDADLMDQQTGFDSSTSVWQQTGWSEVDSLRKKLENLKELRDLVRQLGRAGGKGPLRMAPQEVSLSTSIAGVVTSCCVSLCCWHCSSLLG